MLSRTDNQSSLRLRGKAQRDSMSTVTKSKIQWNYFIALEDDLVKVARYIEFHEDNLNVFSIELAHLLLSAASEVDVMAKCVCGQVAPKSKPVNINDYRVILMKAGQKEIPNVATVKVLVRRYGMNFTPWKNWANDKNPDWWTGYNEVKHQRDRHFDKATLRHAIDAVAALLILNYIYYLNIFKEDAPGLASCAPSSVLNGLSPLPSLMTL